jgi:putative cardiolipin synthase
VRIRLLVDDWNIKGKDFVLAMIDAHPNIEVRVFNPVAGSRSSFLSRPLHYVFGAERIKKRMHNKAFVVDNIVAIVGGRNIGDEYFQAHQKGWVRGCLNYLLFRPVIINSMINLPLKNGGSASFRN